MFYLSPLFHSLYYNVLSGCLVSHVSLVKKRGIFAVKYRLLALNIDGTILRSNSRLSRETKEAIDFAKKKGIYVTLATGRPFIAAKKIAKALKLDGHIITHDGAFIGTDEENPLFDKRISEDQTFQISEVLENYHCHVRLLNESFAIANKVKQKNQLIAKMTIKIGDPLFYPISFYDSICDYLLEEPLATPKIQVQFFDEDEKQSALEELNKVSGISITHKNDHRLEIFSEGVSKARALHHLGMELGISLNEMVAIGATEDDIEMISEVGLGVAMGNAPKNVKEAASWITRSNNMNGVGYTVKEVFRKQLKLEQ